MVGMLSRVPLAPLDRARADFADKIEVFAAVGAEGTTKPTSAH